jgi:flagellar biosynthesis/type III secretory pathway chaperone
MSALSPLKTILLEQEKCCKALVGLLQRERAHLIDFDVHAVEELTKEKDTLLLRLHLLEEERLRLTAALVADGTAAPEGDTTLRALSERTGDAELSAIRLKLVSLAQSIEDLNGFNRHLIDRSLQTVRTASGFFQSLGGHPPPPPRSGSLVSRET